MSLLSYAGIGSRSISANELKMISVIAQKLSRKFVVYSGNAEGSDIAFQSGSNGKCVIYLPWVGFNNAEYDVKNSIAYFDVGNTMVGVEYAKKFHHNYTNLSQGAKRLMCRNTHQVLGFKEYPRVEFVVFCATEKGGIVEGGTGQAIRIARSIGIPTFNIRNGESEKLSNFLKDRYANS